MSCTCGTPCRECQRAAELAPQVEWLRAFMARYCVTNEQLAHILGTSAARPSEWTQGKKAMPAEDRVRLERWAADGCPRFPYWRPYPWRHVGKGETK